MFSRFIIKNINKYNRLANNTNIWNSKYTFSSTHHQQLVHVHIFHRHGDRTPWTPILTTTQEIDFWKSKIPSQYYPKSDWNLSGKQKEEITTWKYVASKLKNAKLCYKHNNWNISSPTIFTSSDNMDINHWSQLRTYDSFESVYLGQLTEIGCKQLQYLGGKLRERYIYNLGYLPGIYNEDTSGLYYNCTNMKRTIHSADNLLSELYPIEQRMNCGLIPLYVDEREYTYLNPSTMARVCPKLNIKFRNNLRSVIEVFDAKFFELTKKVLDHYDVKEEELTHEGFDIAYDSMYCKIAHKMNDIPSNIWKYDDLEAFGVYMSKIHCGMMNWDRESLKLSWGNILYNMMKLMKECEGKFIISSCHDNSLLAVLCSVYGDKWNSMNFKWPYYLNGIYADYLTFEVWKDTVDGKKSVKLLYNGQELDAFDGNYAIDLNYLCEKWKDLTVDEETYFTSACV